MSYCKSFVVKRVVQKDQETNGLMRPIIGQCIRPKRVAAN